MTAAVKSALEDLLRARRLQGEPPPLRGDDRRFSFVSTGVPAVDGLLRGGLPRGQVSEVHGAPSSGRTGLALALVAHATTRGALAAWVDPGDRLDPPSAHAAGTDLARTFWLRGDVSSPRALPDSVSALGTLVGSGLFEVVVLDLGGVPRRDLQRLPGATWIRLQRTVESTPTAVLLLGDAHVAHGPLGVSIGLQGRGARWSGRPPGRLLRGLSAEAAAGPRGRVVALELVS